VPEELKHERYSRFMDTQAAISAHRMNARVGKTLEILVDEIVPGGAVGRSYADAPEIDGRVLLTARRPLRPGELVDAVIETADDHDLGGRVVSEATRPGRRLE